MMPCGPDIAVLIRYSLISFVFGSTWPSTLPHMPAHQIVPSFAASGSCGREPSVSAFHSRKLTCTGPGTTTDFGRGFSGKVLPRYAATVFSRSSGSLTIDPIRSFHPCSVYPHELVMLATPWQTVHVIATASLPGAFGRFSTPLVLPR